MERSPRTLLQKLGLKSTHRIAVLGFVEREFMEGLPHEVCLVENTVYDFILFQAESVEKLSALRQVKKALSLTGGLWVIYPKGVKSITQRQVFFYGNADGYTDTKVCRFSESHTGLKFVRRIEHRS